NTYIYLPIGAFWIAEAVNAVVAPVNEGGKLLKASEWLKARMSVTSLTNDPSIEGELIAGVNCDKEGTLVPTEGARVYNRYRPPTQESGDPVQAIFWTQHVERLMPRPGDAEQFMNYMAHRAQHPGVKPRFALLIAGDQGVGKDTAIEFCGPAIGEWNIANI